MEWILPEYIIHKGKFYCRRPHFFWPGRLLAYISLYETSMSPKGNLKKLRARKGSSHINKSVWWLWIWVEVVASRPQTLLSLVKGDLGMQRFCQLDYMGSFLPESFRKAVLGVAGWLRANLELCVAPLEHTYYIWQGSLWHLGARVSSGNPDRNRAIVVTEND